MALEWTITAGVGLMVGVAFGILIELRYVVLIDKKIERMLGKVERIEERILQDVEKKAAKKKALKRRR